MLWLMTEYVGNWMIWSFCPIYLHVVFSRVALTFSTNAFSAVVAQCCCCVVRPAAILEIKAIKAEGRFVIGAFAVLHKEVGRAFAQTTVVGSSPVAARRELFVILAVSGRPCARLVRGPARPNHIAWVQCRWAWPGLLKRSGSGWPWPWPVPIPIKKPCPRRTWGPFPDPCAIWQ